jgi:hypothetical protein
MSGPAKVFGDRENNTGCIPTGSKPQRSAPLMAAGVLIALGAVLFLAPGQ